MRLKLWNVTATAAPLSEAVARIGLVGVATAAVALLVALDAAGAAVAAVASIVAASVVAGASPLLAVVLLLGWIAMQNLVAPVLLTVAGLGVDDVRAIIGTKELMALSILAVLSFPAVLWGRMKLLGCDKLWLAYSCWVLLYAVNPLVERAEPFYLAVSLRALLVPVLFYALGRVVALDDSRTAISVLTAAFLSVAVAAAVFGVVEVLLLGDEFWRALDIKRYWVEVKGFSPRTIVDDLPGNFYGRYGSAYGLGPGIRRLASTYGDPLAAAYNLFFAALLCFAGSRLADRRFKTAYAIGFALLAGALALTISRVALVALAIGCTLVLLRERTVFRTRGLLVLALLGLGLLFVFRGALAPAFVSAITMEDPSTRSHLLDLARGLQELASPRALLGFGLGTAGAPAAASQVHIGISESAYLVLLAQVGMGGLLLFLAASISTYRFLVRSTRAAGTVPFLIPAASAGLAGYAFSGILSEQIFTTTSLAAFWILLGVAVSWCGEHASENRSSQ